MNWIPFPIPSGLICNWAINWNSRSVLKLSFGLVFQGWMSPGGCSYKKKHQMKTRRLDLQALETNCLLPAVSLKPPWARVVASLTQSRVSCVAVSLFQKAPSTVSPAAITCSRWTCLPTHPYKQAAFSPQSVVVAAISHTESQKYIFAWMDVVAEAKREINSAVFNRADVQNGLQLITRFYSRPRLLALYNNELRPTACQYLFGSKPADLSSSNFPFFSLYYQHDNLMSALT